MRGLRIGVLGLALLLVGCSSDADRPASSNPSDTTLTDALDRRVSVPQPLSRVVSLAPNLTEIVFAAGGGGRLVGVTTSCDFPPETGDLPKISALPVDFEGIVSLQPDAVLASAEINAARDIDTFDTLDLPIVYYAFDTVEDVFDAIRATGVLLGTKAAARDTAKVLQTRLDRLSEQTEPLAKPRVLVLISDETLYAFGAGSYVHTLVDAAGGTSITASIDQAAPTLSEEYVLTQKPDVIIGAFGADYDPDTLLTLHPTWDVVPAVRNNRVYSVEPSLLLRPGPRIVQGAETIARQLHPDRFDDAE